MVVVRRQSNDWEFYFVDGMLLWTSFIGYSFMDCFDGLL